MDALDLNATAESLRNQIYSIKRELKLAKEQHESEFGQMLPTPAAATTSTLRDDDNASPSIGLTSIRPNARPVSQAQLKLIRSMKDMSKKLITLTKMLTAVEDKLNQHLPKRAEARKPAFSSSQLRSFQQLPKISTTPHFYKADHEWDFGYETRCKTIDMDAYDFSNQDRMDREEELLNNIDVLCGAAPAESRYRDTDFFSLAEKGIIKQELQSVLRPSPSTVGGRRGSASSSSMTCATDTGSIGSCRSSPLQAYSQAAVQASSSRSVSTGRISSRSQPSPSLGGNISICLSGSRDLTNGLHCRSSSPPHVVMNNNFYGHFSRNNSSNTDADSNSLMTPTTKQAGGNGNGNGNNGSGNGNDSNGNGASTSKLAVVNTSSASASPMSSSSRPASQQLQLPSSVSQKQSPQSSQTTARCNNLSSRSNISSGSCNSSSASVMSNLTSNTAFTSYSQRSTAIPTFSTATLAATIGSNAPRLESGPPKLNPGLTIDCLNAQRRITAGSAQLPLTLNSFRSPTKQGTNAPASASSSASTTPTSFPCPALRPNTSPTSSEKLFLDKK